jgi:hypothetical protein
MPSCRWGPGVMMTGYVWTILAAVLFGVVISGVVPAVSRRRNRRRAQASGALWVGLANFGASQGGQAPVVEHALSGTGPLYGSSLSRTGRQKPVGRLRYLSRDALRWEPTIWLGRGKASDWELPMAKLRDHDG